MFIAGAVLCGLLPVIGLEAGLRLAGIGDEITYQDPLVGFSRVSPLFERDEQAGVYRTARSHQVAFEEQEFAIPKPAKGIRIFCLGGSTVRGRPYTTESAFARWLQIELAARDPDHSYEVVNCGGLSYASYRLSRILEEVLVREPDLIIVATGHNEFLEDRTYADLKERSWLRSRIEDRLHQLRTFRVLRELVHGESGGVEGDRTVLPEEVEPRLDQLSGYGSYHRDDEWAAQVHEHFGRSLEAMISMCREAGVPIVLALLGSNVRDCPPFKSEHRPGLSLEEERAWQAGFDQASVLQDTDPSQALQHYQAAAQIDDEYALLRFRIARLLDRLGRTSEAGEHYLAAKDLDVCPLRMLDALAVSQRKIAERTGTPLIDARGLIEARCEAQLAGNDWYMDHVHPTIGGHQVIARALAGQSDKLLAGVSLRDWSEGDRRQAYGEHLRKLGPVYLINGYERVSWLEKWARRQRLFEETLPGSAAELLRYGHREWDFGRRDEAWEHYLVALEADPEMVTRLLDRVSALRDQGRPQEALELLDRLQQDGRVSADEVESLRSGLAAESARPLPRPR